MEMTNIPFGLAQWHEVPETVHPGETGIARWRTRQSAPSGSGLSSIHPAIAQTIGAKKATSCMCSMACWKPNWEMAAASPSIEGPGPQVADAAQPHRSSTKEGARLFIVDEVEAACVQSRHRTMGITLSSKRHDPKPTGMVGPAVV